MDGPSLYQYASNGPFSKSDPMGLCVGAWSSLTCRELAQSFLDEHAPLRSAEFMKGYVREPVNFVLEDIPAAGTSLLETLESDPMSVLLWPSEKARSLMDAVIIYPGEAAERLKDSFAERVSGYLNATPYEQGATTSFVVIDAATAAKGTSLTLARRQLTEVEIGEFLKGKKRADARRHAQDAVDRGCCVTGVIDRPGAAARRRERLRNVQTAPGFDRDEFPPAVIRPDKPAKVSVDLVESGANRSSGAVLGNEIKDLPDGTRVKVRVPERGGSN